MSKIFPIRGERDLDLDDPVIVELGSEDAEVYLDALSSKTTRKIFVHIHDEPSTMSDLSETFDDSIQNIKYHIEKLEESNLVETTGNDYSEKGNEMSVYAPTNEALVMLAGTEESKTKIRNHLRPVGAFVVLSLLVSGTLSYFSSIQSDINRSTEMTAMSPPSSDISTDSVGTNAESTTEVTSDLVIGFVSTSPEIAVLLLSIISILIGAGLYHILLNRV